MTHPSLARSVSLARWLAPVILGFVALQGCGSKDGGGDGDADGSSCVPGKTEVCAGMDGCSGVQTCNESGTFEECVCSNGSNGTGGLTGSGGSSNGTGSTSSGGSSSNPQGGSGSGTETGGTSNGEGGSGSTPKPPAGGCKPKDMSSWTPPAYTPARPAADVCTDEEIRNYYSQCLLKGDCEDFEDEGASAACGTCMTPTALGAAAYGPVLLTKDDDGSKFWNSNVPGCVELVGNAKCAAKMQTADRCASEACSSCLANTTDYAPYDACLAAARKGACAQYVKGTNCITDPSHLIQCRGSTFEQLVGALGKVFCGKE
jgi:hypothetical protein